MKWPLIPLLIMLSACDSATPPQPKTAPQPNAIFDTQVEAVKKARAVEGQLLDAATAQRKQIDEATQQ